MRKHFKAKIVKFMDITAHSFKKENLFVRQGDFIDWVDWTETWKSDSWDGETRPPHNWLRLLTFEEMEVNLFKAVASLMYNVGQINQLLNILISGLDQVSLNQ